MQSDINGVDHERPADGFGAELWHHTNHAIDGRRTYSLALGAAARNEKEWDRPTTGPCRLDGFAATIGCWRVLPIQVQIKGASLPDVCG